MKEKSRMLARKPPDSRYMPTIQRLCQPMRYRKQRKMAVVRVASGKRDVSTRGKELIKDCQRYDIFNTNSMPGTDAPSACWRRRAAIADKTRLSSLSGPLRQWRASEDPRKAFTMRATETQGKDPSHRTIHEPRQSMPQMVQQ